MNILTDLETKFHFIDRKGRTLIKFFITFVPHPTRSYTISFYLKMKSRGEVEFAVRFIFANKQ